MVSKRNDQLHLAAWMIAGPGRPDGWRSAGADRGWLTPAYYKRLAALLERGLFDFAFFPDILCIPNTFESKVDSQLRYGGIGSIRLDPMPVLSIMAAASTHLGLASTVSTTYAEPFYVARAFSTLDFLTEGRAGWNVVTSYQEAEAKNFGRDMNADKNARYERAEEFLSVVTQLWDSWDDDALVLDAETPLFVDPSKVREIHHSGQWFNVTGPLSLPRSPQGYPLIIQAGSSPAGRDLGARWSDAIFSSPGSIEASRSFYADMKARAAAHGRHPGELKILPSVTVLVRSTAAEAQEALEELEALSPLSIGLSTLSFRLGVDLSLLPLDEPLPELFEPSSSGAYEGLADLSRKKGLTLRQLGLQAGGTFNRDFVGTPTQVADAIEEWFVSEACDGFSISGANLPQAFEEFVAGVVPELQRRGLFRTKYEGRTLRENLGAAPAPRGEWRRRAKR